MLKVVNGDLLEAKERMICHQVNCMGEMGGGIARQFANKFPDLEIAYRNYTNETKKEAGYKLLGQVFPYSVLDENGTNKTIFNIYMDNGILAAVNVKQIILHYLLEL